MADFNPRSTPDDASVDHLVRVDEQLIATDDTQPHHSTAAIDDLVDEPMADCLMLLQRVRKEAGHWPGRPDGWEWLYTEELTPQRIGRFEVRRRLGMGGFGIVFLAHDPRLDREVALKVPRLETMISPESRRRFLRESKLAAALAHPNIAAVFEAGIIDPVAYIATAYCSGGSIVDLLAAQGGRLPPMAAARLTMALAQAVQHAHSRGILHRDIKPSNVLLDIPSDQVPQLAADPEQLAQAARLVDFGMARNLESARHDAPPGEDPTHSGAMLGTPAYMAPEQVTGHRESVTESVDIYALGATLFCLLVGQPPFRRRSDWETLQAVQHEDPPVPSRALAGIPHDLDAICRKCLEKRPSDRYRTASELEQDLQRFLNGEPTLARPLSGLQRTWRWCRRNPALSGSLALLSVVLISATLVSTAMWLKADRARRQSALHEAEASVRAEEALRQTKRVRQAVDELLTAIAQEPSIRSQGLEKFRLKLLASASGFYKQLWLDRPKDRSLPGELAATFLRLAEVHAQLDAHGKAVEICQNALTMLDETDDQDFSLGVTIRKQLSSSLSVLGRQDEASAVLEKNIEVLRKLQMDDSVTGDFEFSGDIETQLAYQLSSAAELELYFKNFARAEALNKEAIEIIAGQTGVSPQQWADNETNLRVLSTQADLLVQTGRPDEGGEFAQRALDVFNEIYASRMDQESSIQYDHAQLLFTLGVSGSYAGDYQLAASSYERSIELLADLVRRHPDVGLYQDQWISQRYSRALIHFFQQEFDDAEEILLTNVDTIDAAADQFPDRARVLGIHKANCLNLLYGIYRRTDRAQEARETLLTAIDTCSQLLIAFADDTYISSLKGSFTSNLGFLDNREHKHEDSLRNYLSAIDVLEPCASRQGPGESLDWLAGAYVGAAAAYQNLGEFAAAMEQCDMFLKRIPTEHSLTFDVHRELVTLHVRSKQYDKSLERLRELVASDTTAQKLFKLAKTSAECVGIIETHQALGSSEDAATKRVEFVETALGLIELSLASDQLDRTVAKEELTTATEFDSLRNDQRFAPLISRL